MTLEYDSIFGTMLKLVEIDDERDQQTNVAAQQKPEAEVPNEQTPEGEAEPKQDVPDETPEEEIDLVDLKDNEYLGVKGQDESFYLKRVNKEGTNELEDILVADAAGEKQFTFKEKGYEDFETQFKKFLVDAIDALDISLVSYEVIMKFFVDKEEVEEEEEEEMLDKEVGVQPDAVDTKKEGEKLPPPNESRLNEIDKDDAEYKSLEGSSNEELIKFIQDYGFSDQGSEEDNRQLAAELRAEISKQSNK